MVIEMSGTPAPKSPIDWWHQAEVARPGFLQEGNIHQLKKRLSLVEERENPITGGVYPHLITWLDDADKCSVCGEPKDDPRHNPFAEGHYTHDFKPSVKDHHIVVFYY